MTRFAHLDRETIEMMEFSKQERMQCCLKDRWVGYTRALQILDRLDEVVNYPRTLRMPNVLLIGRSGNGKSSVLEQFIDRHPVQVTAAGTPIADVLCFEMPESPSETEFWSAILWMLGMSHGEKDHVSVKKKAVYSGLEYTKAKVLVIDEFNNLVNAGKHAGIILAAIKGLSNRLKISFIAAGTQAAINALNSEPQMKSRFQPAVLERWTLDKEYLRFLASYERLLPLSKPSTLNGREVASQIYAMMGDTVGGIAGVLKKAAHYAIETGEEQITPELLKELDWTRPAHWDDVAKKV